MKLRFCALSLCCALLLTANVGCESRKTPTPTPPRPIAETLPVKPNRRFGFGVNRLYGQVTDYDVAQLNAGWYADWGISDFPARPAGLEYVQLVSVGRAANVPNRGALRAAVEAQRGALWLIGNEPERRAVDDPSGMHRYSDLTPKEYAVIYRDLYRFIKGIDPTARIAIGGVVQPSPLRLRWLDMVWEEYQALTGERMPVDVWNTHIQIVREKRDFPGCGDCWGADVPKGIEEPAGLLLEIKDNVRVDLLKDFVIAFRRWMKEKGEQEKPLIISEFGVLMPSEFLAETPEAGEQLVIKFMYEAFDFFLQARDKELGYPPDDYRLVQMWLWFSLNDPPFHYDEKLKTWIGFNGGLFDWRNPHFPGTLTPLGKAFAEYTAKLLTESGP